MRDNRNNDKEPLDTLITKPTFALQYLPGSAAAGCFGGKVGLHLLSKEPVALASPIFYYILPRFASFDGFDPRTQVLGRPEVAVLSGFDTHGRHVVRLDYRGNCEPLVVPQEQTINLVRFRHLADAGVDTDVLTICVATPTPITGSGQPRQPYRLAAMAPETTWLGEAVITVHPKETIAGETKARQSISSQGQSAS